MENTLTKLLISIVRHPDEIVITKEEPNPGYVIFSIASNEEDKGLIIGKGGRTIKSLQDIIAVKAIKENKKVTLRIA